MPNPSANTKAHGCCDGSQTTSRTCPVNGKTYPNVPYTTVMHHLTKPWIKQPARQGYYFCEDPDCVVAYYGDDGSVFTVSDLRMQLGIKKQCDNDSLICYCYDISRAEANRSSACKSFVIKMTKAGNCNCEILNPAGRCCLKNFPKTTVTAKT